MTHWNKNSKHLVDIKLYPPQDQDQRMNKSNPFWNKINNNINSLNNHWISLLAAHHHPTTISRSCLNAQQFITHWEIDHFTFFSSNAQDINHRPNIGNLKNQNIQPLQIQKKSKLNNQKHQFNTPKRLIHNHVVSYGTFKRPKLRTNFSYWCSRPRRQLVHSYWETSGDRHLLYEIHYFSQTYIQFLCTQL